MVLKPYAIPSNIWIIDDYALICLSVEYLLCIYIYTYIYCVYIYIHTLKKNTADAIALFINGEHLNNTTDGPP